MPKDEDLERVTQQLFNAIASEPELKNSVETFKIKVLLESDHSWDHQKVTEQLWLTEENCLRPR